MKKLLPFLIILILISSCKTKPYWGQSLPESDKEFYGLGYAQERTDEASRELALKEARINLATNIADKLSTLNKEFKYRKNTLITQTIFTPEETESYASYLRQQILADDNLTGITKMRKDKQRGYYILTTLSTETTLQLTEASGQDFENFTLVLKELMQAASEQK